jgi:hypothetical protein
MACGDNTSRPRRHGNNNNNDINKIELRPSAIMRELLASEMLVGGEFPVVK